ncbi:GDSL lipase/esterase - like 10 [Theobroma cacao]|nr:GDSL lipase/esterase - like 10 [Theobroma cacao]
MQILLNFLCFSAESLGPPDLNAYLASVGTNFSHGANFAVAGATIRQTAFNPISLGEDLRFLINKSAAIEKLLPKEDYLPRALYTFDIGQKDLTAGYKLNLTTQVVKAYVPYLLTQFSSILKERQLAISPQAYASMETLKVDDNDASGDAGLYYQGGRTFWIHYTGPVGCLPYVLDHFPVHAGQVDKFGCANPFNDFNGGLKRVDLSILLWLVVVMVGTITITGSYIVVTRLHGINWDGTHLTEAANKWIFEQIANGSFSDQPLPLRIACNRQDH